MCVLQEESKKHYIHVVHVYTSTSTGTLELLHSNARIQYSNKDTHTCTINNLHSSLYNRTSFVCVDEYTGTLTMESRCAFSMSNKRHQKDKETQNPLNFQRKKQLRVELCSRGKCSIWHEASGGLTLHYQLLSDVGNHLELCQSQFRTAGCNVNTQDYHTPHSQGNVQTHCQARIHSLVLL